MANYDQRTITVTNEDSNKTSKPLQQTLVKNWRDDLFDYRLTQINKCLSNSQNSNGIDILCLSELNFKTRWVHHAYIDTFKGYRGRWETQIEKAHRKLSQAGGGRTLATSSRSEKLLLVGKAEEERAKGLLKHNFDNFRRVCIFDSFKNFTVYVDSMPVDKNGTPKENRKEGEDIPIDELTRSPFPIIFLGKESVKDEPLCSAIILSRQFLKITTGWCSHVCFKSYTGDSPRLCCPFNSIKKVFGNEPMCSLTFKKNNTDLFTIYTIHTKEPKFKDDGTTKENIENKKLYNEISQVQGEVPFTLIGDLNEDLNQRRQLSDKYSFEKLCPKTAVNIRSLSQNQFYKGFDSDINKTIDYSLTENIDGKYTQGPISVKVFGDIHSLIDYDNKTIPTEHHASDHALIETNITFTPDESNTIQFKLGGYNLAGPNATHTEYLTPSNNMPVDLANKPWSFDISDQETSKYFKNSNNQELKTLGEYLTEQQKLCEESTHQSILTNMGLWAELDLPKYVSPITSADGMAKKLKGNDLVKHALAENFDFSYQGIWKDDNDLCRGEDDNDSANEEKTVEKGLNRPLLGIVAILAIEKICGDFIKNNSGRSSCSINNGIAVNIDDIYTYYRDKGLFS